MTIIGLALIAVGILFIYNGYLGFGKWYDPIKSVVGTKPATTTSTP